MLQYTLLNSFLFISKYYGKDISKNTLLAQLPNFDGDIPFQYMTRVAQKLSLETKVIHFDKRYMSKEFLPIIVKSRDNIYSVLLDYNGDEVTLTDANITNSVQNLSIDDFLEIYGSSDMVLIRRSFDFNKSTNRFKTLNPKGWFMDTFFKNKSIYFQLILSTLFINILVLVLPMFTLNIYDRVIPNNAIDTLWVMSFAVIVALLLDFVLKLLRTYFLSDIGKKSDVIVSINIFEHLMNLKLEEKPTSTGIFANTLSSFEKIREFLTSATLVALIDMPFAILFIIIIFLVGGDLGFVPLISTILIIFIALISQQRLKPIIEDSYLQSKIKHGVLVESVYGLETIKAIGASNRMYSRWEQSVKDTVESNHKIHIESKLASTLISTIIQISSIILVMFGAYLAIIDKSITTGVIIASTILSSRAMSPIAQFVGILSQFNITITSYKALDSFMMLNDDRYRNKNYVRLYNTKPNIVLDNVTFRYPNAQFNNLENINLTITYGEKIAILGRVGSGKSTLIKLISNLYEPTSGSIMLGDIEFRNIDSNDLREKITLIPQDVMIFDGSLRDNIAIGQNNISDNRLFEILNIVGLSNFVKRHKEGLDMKIGERGDGLSGGEKKSLTIARGLASDSPILLADELTDSIDSQSEKYIVDNISSSIKDKTFIVVTHKPAILRLVDRILVMEDGKIVMDGARDKVLAELRV